MSIKVGAVAIALSVPARAPFSTGRSQAPRARRKPADTGRIPACYLRSARLGWPFAPSAALAHDRATNSATPPGHRPPGAHDAYCVAHILTKAASPISRRGASPGNPRMRLRARGYVIDPHSTLPLGYVPNFPGSSSQAGLEILVLATKVRILPRERLWRSDSHPASDTDSVLVPPGLAISPVAASATAAHAQPSI